MQKRLLTYLGILTICLGVCITDFKGMGIPWEPETVSSITIQYVPIASDQTDCPDCTEIIPQKQSMKRLSLTTEE
jgi:hypothetical protein